MKITALALLTIFAASSSAFGLNGGAKAVTRRTVGAFKKPALVQPVDINGNRITSTVVSVHRYIASIAALLPCCRHVQ